MIVPWVAIMSYSVHRAWTWRLKVSILFFSESAPICKKGEVMRLPQNPQEHNTTKKAASAVTVGHRLQHCREAADCTCRDESRKGSKRFTWPNSYGMPWKDSISSEFPMPVSGIISQSFLPWWWLAFTGNTSLSNQVEFPNSSVFHVFRDIWAYRFGCRPAIRHVGGADETKAFLARGIMQGGVWWICETDEG